VISVLKIFEESSLITKIIDAKIQFDLNNSVQNIISLIMEYFKEKNIKIIEKIVKNLKEIRSDPYKIFYDNLFGKFLELFDDFLKSRKLDLSFLSDFTLITKYSIECRCGNQEIEEKILYSKFKENSEILNGAFELFLGNFIPFFVLYLHYFFYKKDIEIQKPLICNKGCPEVKKTFELLKIPKILYFDLKKFMKIEMKRVFLKSPFNFNNKIILRANDRVFVYKLWGINTLEGNFQLKNGLKLVNLLNNPEIISLLFMRKGKKKIFVFLFHFMIF
jgi:Txe/YoeB family toxin of Txe-Axe toxin-antitoxin module